MQSRRRPRPAAAHRSSLNEDRPAPANAGPLPHRRADHHDRLRGSRGHRPSSTKEVVIKTAIIAPPWFELPPRGYGGIEWMCYWLAEGLVRRGHDVTLIGAGSGRTAARFIPTFEQPPTARLGDGFPELLHLARAGSVLRSLHADVVHAHILPASLLGLLSDLPTVATAHGPVTRDLEDYYRAIGGAVSLVAISEAQRRSAPKLPWAATVHNGIPVAEYPLRKHKEAFVLWLGRMSPEKAPHLAIDAARRAGMRIVLAGKLNEVAERAYFDAEVAPRMGRGVDWVGEADEVTKKELLAAARCLVLPIQWEEPFGIVMVEAMACGTPVVALSAGSAPEVVVDGVTGFVCRDPEDLPEAIAGADLIDPLTCRDHAMRRFDVDRMVTGYEEVYREAVGGRPRELSMALG